MPTTLEFQLPDMSCGHCASRVTQALKQVDPDGRVRVDLKTCRVQVDSREDRATLVEALSEAGYPPA